MKQKKLLSAWVKASRPQSQSYIFLPLLLGQACYFQLSGNFDWTIFVIVQLFGFFDQLYIVYANDYADIETDFKNKTFNIFSGGSRVLVDGDLEPAQIKKAAWITVGFCLLCGIVLTIGFSRSLSIPLISISLLLLWAYSCAPIRLSYRGGGEFLQIIGVGAVLPLLGYYAQSGSFENFPYWLFLALLPAQLSCSMSTSLPDQPSDAASGKLTSSVILGLILNKVAIACLCLITIGLLFLLYHNGIIALPIIKVLILPTLASLVHFAVLKSEPGTVGLTIFNISSVSFILSLQAGIIVSFFAV